MAFESQFVRSNAGTDIIKTGDSGHDADFEVKEDDNGNFELAEKRRQEAHSSAPIFEGNAAGDENPILDAQNRLDSTDTDIVRKGKDQVQSLVASDGGFNFGNNDDITQMLHQDDAKVTKYN